MLQSAKILYGHLKIKYQKLICFVHRLHLLYDQYQLGIRLESDLETEVFIIVVLEDNGVGLADFQVVQNEFHAASADAVAKVAVFVHGHGNVVFLHVDFL